MLDGGLLREVERKGRHLRVFHAKSLWFATQTVKFGEFKFFVVRPTYQQHFAAGGNLCALRWRIRSSMRMTLALPVKTGRCWSEDATCFFWKEVR